ncbi:MAG: FAD-dependent oxidoreductase [Nannocystaceae bacterium]
MPAPETPPIAADVLVIGAGISGLSCARALVDAARGLRVVVVDKGRGLGGRCATRRVGDQAIDHGLAFIHGRDPGLIAALDATPGALAWPTAVVGAGRPCQPRAFAAGERRFAFAAGLTAFAKRLADGLEIHRGARVVALAPGLARAADGRRFAAPTIVLTPPLPQTRALLGDLRRDDLAEADAGALRSIDGLLRMLGSVPCLTAIAGYPRERTPPAWDLLVPDDAAIQQIAHDSRKRPDPAAHVLVVQATPRWSRAHLEEDPARWSAALLAAAAPHLPDALGPPRFVDHQRWRYARQEGAEQLREPILLDLDGGRRLGLTGEAFDLRGGAEGAWLAGRALAERLLRSPAQPPRSPRSDP